MAVFRWLMLIPGALLLGMLGSFAGGWGLRMFGSQSFMDAGSAFVGCFAAAFSAGLIAPSWRAKVTLGTAGVIVLLALLACVLTFGPGPDYRPPLDKVLIPVAQILGALYAVFLLPPTVAHGITLEQAWKEVIALGTTVAFLGIIISLGGLVAALLGYPWGGLHTGLGVVALGAVTWLFPYGHLFLRFRNAERAFIHQLRQGKKDTTIPEIGRAGDMGWIDVVRHVFRVLDFDRVETTIGPGNEVEARSPFEPYGYLRVEAPILNEQNDLPIVHRDDFILAASVFDEPRMLELIEGGACELLVTYVPKDMLPEGLTGLTHGLHYVIVPRGTMEQYYEAGNHEHLASPVLEKLFGGFVWVGEVKVNVNREPAL